MDPPDGQNPVLDIGGSQQKGARSVFQGDGSQITGGGSESWGGGTEIRRDPPNLTPAAAHLEYHATTLDFFIGYYQTTKWVKSVDN